MIPLQLFLVLKLGLIWNFLCVLATATQEEQKPEHLEALATEEEPGVFATEVEQEDVILKHLMDSNVTRIVLTGESGVGKTWMANEISKWALESICFGTLWVFPNPGDGSRWSLLVSIARQLSVLSTTEEWEDHSTVNDDQKKTEETDQEWQDKIVNDEKEANDERLKEMISDKLEKMRSAPSEKTKFLLILDGVPDNENEEIIKELEAILPLEVLEHKFLIIRKEVNEIESESNKKVFKIEPLSEKDSLSQLKKRVKKNVLGGREFEKSFEEIAKMSQGLPAAILMIAEALNHIGEHESVVRILEEALEEAAFAGVIPLLRYAYDRFPSTDMALINCCWGSRQLFLKLGGIHYDELIACWILEGYISANDRLDKAYEEGYRVLMKLINLHMLKIREDGLVMMERLALKFTDDHRHGCGSSNLGLASVLEYGNRPGIWRVAPAEGMIKTPYGPKSSNKISTLLINGSRFSREAPETFFKPMKELQVLALFNPRFKSLPKSLSEIHNLQFLVLRGCDQLGSIDQIKEFEHLTVLEISGASSLKNIEDDFFEKMKRLRSLNLSGLQVQSLPSSLFKLTEPRLLILRECPKLKTLPNLKKFENLEVLDLHGCTSLNEIKDKCLSSLQKLQMLDLSQTKINHLPILKTLKLTQLILRDCKGLSRLCKLESLTDLQILDLSSTTALKQMRDDSLNKKDKLKILNLSKSVIDKLRPSSSQFQVLDLLDLSECVVEIPENTFKGMKQLRHLNISNTNIVKLPSLSELGNLRQLFLRHCPLKELPKTEGLKRLQELDLSNASSLVDFQDKSFEHLVYLRDLNFSNTKIKILPSIAKLKNLRKVLLQNCGDLTELLLSKELEKLEELDLSGCTALKEIEANVLENMVHLRSLNLSGTSLKLPQMSKLTNLIELSIQGCKFSDSEPDLGNCTKLEVLDLSETDIQSLPSLENFGNLRDLKLRGCSGLKKLLSLKSATHLEVLDLWGTGIKEWTGITEFPSDISELTRLKHLDLPDLKDFRSLNWGEIKHLPEELNWDQCGIFKHIQNRPCMSVSGTKIFKNLKEEPGLWDTCFEEFQFSVCALEKEDRARDIWWHRADANFRKIYFQTHSFPETIGRYLEILGFDKFPEDIDDVLMKAEYVSLIEDKFVTRLSDLRMGNVNAMKGCWLERCVKMETILSGAEMEKNLTILWASNLPELKSVYSEEMQSGGLANLTELYLHCCPMIEAVFPSSLLPENLKILQIKFCDELKTLFKPTESKECKLRKLEKLHLVELPKLIRMWVPSENISDIFPSFTEIKIKECPKLENLGTIMELHGASVENSKID
ncbi:putative disease resistance protein At4g19050 [Fagus crenata]